MKKVNAIPACLPTTFLTLIEDNRVRAYLSLATIENPPTSMGRKIGEHHGSISDDLPTREGTRDRYG
jgi:hypothetical protein